MKYAQEFIVHNGIAMDCLHGAQAAADVRARIVPTTKAGRRIQDAPHHVLRVTFSYSNTRFT